MRPLRPLFCLLSLSAALTLTAPASATDEAPTAEAMNARMQQLEREIATLRDRLGDQELDTERREQVKALVREVLADADTRASLLQESTTAGYDNGFFVASADGDNLLKIAGVVKPRYVFNHQENPPDDALSGNIVDENRGGFELTCSRLTFSGHVIDPTWRYIVVTKVNNAGNVTLLDANVEKQLPGGFAVAAGQFKAPLLIEDVISETRQQFVDRSLVGTVLGGGYTQGLQASWTGDRLRLYGSLNDGVKQVNSPWDAADAEYAATARGELKLAGDWKGYAEFTSWRGDPPKAVIGSAIHYQDGEFGTSASEAEVVRVTADALVGGGGWSAFGAVVGNHVATRTDELTMLAAVVQGGVFVTDQVELIARYEWGDSDIPGEEDLSVATAGFNFFLKRHAAKFTFDVGYGLSAVGATWANTGVGWRPDSSGEEGQVVTRAQFQLLF